MKETHILHCSEKMSIAILQLKENGSLIKMKRRWWIDKGECGAQEENQVGITKVLSPCKIILIFNLILKKKSSCSFYYYDTSIWFYLSLQVTWPNRYLFYTQGNKKKKSLSLSNLAGVFFILISGLVFSIILAVCYFLRSRSNNKQGVGNWRASQER